jgi:hypothetical protein
MLGGLKLTSAIGSTQSFVESSNIDIPAAVGEFFRY